jgi:DNA-binding LacI/PurR family transcriptional regulator
VNLLLSTNSTEMKNIFGEIRELEDIPGLTKHEQLTQGIINAIDLKLISRGDALPSVNQFIKELGFARETIVKAYRELKDRGIIIAQNRMGYFVANEDTEQSLKVALMMFGYDTFQEVFYRNFRDGLGDKVHLDVFFHHNNIEVFETMLSLIRGRYGMYVIAPIPHPKTPALLETIPLSKLLMFDRYEPIEGDFCHITQEFEQSSYQALASLVEPIRYFGKMTFYYRPASIVPSEILRAYRKFAKDFDIQADVQPEYKPGSMEKGKVYFTLDNSALYAMIKDAGVKGFKLGEDIGLLSHNDEPVKEIIGNGITTYSTDFGLMGRKAAHYVLTREKIQETIPTLLIRRNSL